MKYFIVIVVEGDVAEPSYFWMIEENLKKIEFITQFYIHFYQN